MGVSNGHWWVGRGVADCNGQRSELGRKTCWGHFYIFFHHVNIMKNKFVTIPDTLWNRNARNVRSFFVINSSFILDRSWITPVSMTILVSGTYSTV